MIPDKRGSVIIPSMVAFTERGTLVGEDVAVQMSHNAENSIYDTKRFIGRNFNDNSIQSGLRVNRWPFSIRQENDRIKIEVNCQGKKENYFPEQISALILKRLKETCEHNLGQEITEAVISVPAYFNDNQRVATKTAGKIAGLNVRRIVNEPTAAALAFGFGRSKFDKDKTILIYDLGGGTFDVSIVNISGNSFLVRATTGDSNLGGQDFTNRLRNHCIEDFKRVHGIDILNNKLALLRLTEACENVKRRLS
ncbi:UNVERIFIED_CONTAM: hypothetical protein GTU68_047171, partial [Idotea baltica]|nr:hypothetical protein [Idotea baltica]